LRGKKRHLETDRIWYQSIETCIESTYESFLTPQIHRRLSCGRGAAPAIFMTMPSAPFTLHHAGFAVRIIVRRSRTRAIEEEGMHNSRLWLGLLILAITVPQPAFANNLPYTGVNLAGAEFGPTPTPGNLGAYGSQYSYPTAAEVDYYISKGVNSFRLPFRWERLQPTQNGPLDATEFARLDSFVSYATSKGAYVAIEPHNFARYYPDPADFQSSTQGLVGTAAVPNSAFANLWSRLASDYKSNSHVIFNLMNEPNTIPTEQWVGSSNSAIAAIRSAGANNLVLVPGNAWTGAWTWFQTWYGTRNATAMLNIVDSANNYAYDVHQYLDSDGSGTSTAIFNNDPTIGVQRLTDFTNWLKQNHRRGYLGEFAVANSTIGTDPAQIGDESLANMLDYLDANSDVWLGWNWWAGGPRWGSYMFTLDPTNLGTANQTDRAAMAVLQPYFTSVPEPGAVGGIAISTSLLLTRRRRS
jgi:endoglucanase